MFTAKPFSWSQTEKIQWLRLDFGLRQTLDSSAVQPGVSFVTTLSCCFLMDAMGINCNHLTELLGRVSEIAQAGCSARDPAHIICRMNKCWPLLSGLGEPLLPLHGTTHGTSDSRPVWKYNIWMPETKPRPWGG